MKEITTFRNWLNEKKIEEKEQTFGCVMMDSNIDKWKEDHTDGIDPKDVYIKPYDESYGIETIPHVTILYGIHEDEIAPEVIMDVVKKDMEAVTVTIKEISIFSNDEYDVVKYDVPVTNQLKKYRSLFEDNFPNTQTFPEFHPHITLAYVKPGEGKKYTKKLEEPFEITFNKGVYSFHEDGEQIRKQHVFKNGEFDIDLTINEWYNNEVNV